MAKKDNSGLLILLTAIGVYAFTQSGSASNGGSSGNSSGIPSTGNYTQNGTVDVPGVGVLPASQQPSGIVYVNYNGQWILMAALQQYFDQAVAPDQQQSSGSNFGNWLSDNQGDLIRILDNLLNQNATGLNDYILDLSTLLPRGQGSFRAL